MTNESALNANWHDVPFIHQNGVILGYRLLLQQDDGGPVVWNVTVGRHVRWYLFTNLETFQTYSTQILAFTIKGDGPMSGKVYQKTDGSGKWRKYSTLTAMSSSGHLEEFFFVKPRAVCKQNEGKRKTEQRIQSKTETTDLKIGVPKYSYIDLAKSQSGAPRPGWMFKARLRSFPSIALRIPTAHIFTRDYISARALKNGGFSLRLDLAI